MSKFFKREVANCLEIINDLQQSLGYNTLINNLVAKVVPAIIEKTYTGLKEKYNEKKNKKEIDNAYINYLSTIIETVGYIKTVYNKDKPTKIEDIFIESDLFLGKEKISSNDIKQLLRLSPSFIQINGTGGIGKTTILKYLFVQVLRQGYFIPVFIELRKINNYNEDINITDFIYDSLLDKNLNIEKRDFKETLQTGKYIFFFDGFDEILQSYQNNIFEQIRDFRSQYPSNHFFVTTRELEIMQSGWGTSTILRVSPLSKEQAIKFVTKISSSSSNIRKRFIEEVENNHFYEKYNSFITNPLLLSIMLMTYERFASLPGKLHLFYASAFSTLYSEHDAMKDGYYREKRLELADIAQDDFEKILESFSIKGYIEKKNIFENKNALLRMVNDSKKIGKIIYIKDFEASNFIYDMINALSLLVKDGNEYRYVHRSFQEYFSAKYIARLDDENQQVFLNNMYTKDFEKFHSDEFFPMLYDIDQQRVTKNFIVPKLKKFFSEIEVSNFYEQILFFIKYFFDSGNIVQQCFEFIEDFSYSSIGLQVKNVKTLRKQRFDIDFLGSRKTRSILSIIRRHYADYQTIFFEEKSQLN